MSGRNSIESSILKPTTANLASQDRVSIWGWIQAQCSHIFPLAGHNCHLFSTETKEWNLVEKNIQSFWTFHDQISCQIYFKIKEDLVDIRLKPAKDDVQVGCLKSEGSWKCHLSWGTRKAQNLRGQRLKMCIIVQFQFWIW